MNVRHALVAAVAAAGLVAASAIPATAMGSGNPYADMQVGVTYTVYQPSYVAGLKVKHIGSSLMSEPGVDQNLLAIYGKTHGRNVSITEGNPMTQDIGQGQLVKTVKVQGRDAKVYAYCDPASSDPCSLKDIGKVGGHIDMTLPAGPGLRETRVWVETIQPRPINGNQLIKVARGLRPAP